LDQATGTIPLGDEKPQTGQPVPEGLHSGGIKKGSAVGGKLCTQVASRGTSSPLLPGSPILHPVHPACEAIV